MEYTDQFGNIYNGEFENGKKEGTGEVIFVDGSSYKGGYTKDSWNGEGIYTSTNGFRYIGEFNDNCFHGSGKLTYAYLSFSKNTIAMEISSTVNLTWACATASATFLTKTAHLAYPNT
jgi:hypothetical protein